MDTFHKANVRTCKWWEAFDLIVGEYLAATHWITCEDSSQNNFTYSRHGVDATRRISRNAGMNQAYSRLMIEGLRKCGFTVRTVVPRGRGKLSAEEFVRLSRYEGSTSQHSRDAAMLVFGL